MKRFLIGFFLSLSMLLLHGYSQLYPHTYQACTCYTAVGEIGKPEVRGCRNDQSSSSLFLSSGTAKERHRMDVTEIEEKEESNEDDDDKALLAEKKKSGRSKHFAATFSTLTAGHLFQGTFKNVGSSLRFSYIRSNPWYIVIRVIRI